MHGSPWPTGELLYAVRLDAARWIGLVLDFEAHCIRIYDPQSSGSWESYEPLFSKLTEELLPALWKSCAEAVRLSTGKRHCTCVPVRCLVCL